MQTNLLVSTENLVLVVDLVLVSLKLSIYQLSQPLLS